MKEKELRLAVVFFGGVSLAVYQHGINREILNLVRASKLYHRNRADDGNVASAALEFHRRYPDEPQRSTGDVYLQCLESVGQQLALRVIVDVISGASAGGMNGIALARALAHDLSLAPLTDMWLKEADMLKLLAPEAKARLWNKWIFWPFVRPLLTRLQREGLIVGKIDAEMAERVSVFLRSRWFKPPLDGRRLAALALDGLTAMENPEGGNESLLPPGTRLDLQVTATDFRGLDRPIFIHDPPVVKEREHRRILRFCLEHEKTGHLQSDFDLDNVPSLAFAARASASYPGAFPPAQVREMDDLLASLHRPWPARSRFLARNFSGYRDQGLQPEEAVLLDGSILDNKPIMAALEAIRTHSAYREVDRRLVYIDPHSRLDKPPPSSGVPGFFTALRGALSDLPRMDPTYNELASVSHYNKHVRRLKETIDHSRRQVTKLLEQSTGGRISGNFTINDLRHWRLTSTNQLAGTTIVYDSYMRALVLEALDFVVELINWACGFARDSTAAHKVEEAIELWAESQSILLADSYRMPDNPQENADMPAFGRMVIDFGLVYKKRRLHFVLHEINDLYENAPLQDGCSPEPEDLDLLKIQIHKLIDEMVMYDDAHFLSEQAVAMCRKLFVADLARMESSQFVSARNAAITNLVKRLGIECDLARRNDDADAVLSSALVLNLAPRCRSAILTSYLGYFYWDIILRPVVSALSLEAGPIEEVLIDRISPDDALSLTAPEAARMLLGGTFAGFGGFLSRATRENDYLWGRLHAIDRLFDILASTVTASTAAAIDFHALKKAAFERVIEEEAGRLTLIPELVARLREAIAAL
ncbi:patatin-like protein [Noviherbaspirillum sedimenti]|uniref:Patatin-like protein n=1 Tax=Noviherbaspirillum sedimenti TaxID=2320865 RepID=A0A3A3G189_9BURK|nr:patatin-like protein [Noviherbaspirillum sedimenti]RJG02207.1 patatin-like protein [Noviherbaspirillum sedimenti]